MESYSLNRREHERYHIKDDVFIMCQKRAGRVIDISEGGMSIKISDSLESLVSDPDTTFLSVTPISEINGLPLRIVRKGEVELPRIGGFATQTVGVKFEDLSPGQHVQVRNHISNYLSTSPS